MADTLIGKLSRGDYSPAWNMGKDTYERIGGLLDRIQVTGTYVVVEPQSSIVPYFRLLKSAFYEIKPIMLRKNRQGNGEFGKIRKTREGNDEPVPIYGIAGFATLFTLAQADLNLYLNRLKNNPYALPHNRLYDRLDAIRELVLEEVQACGLGILLKKTPHLFGNKDKDGITHNTPPNLT